MPQIREQIAMVHLPPSKTLKYLFHVRKTKPTSIEGCLPVLFTPEDCGFSAILQQFYIFTGAASIAERGHLWYHGRRLRIFGEKRKWRQQTKL